MNFSLTREYDWLIPQPLERTPHSSQPCERITANLTAALDGGQDGNCFLKNTIGRYYPTSNTSMAAGILGGGTS